MRFANTDATVDEERIITARRHGGYGAGGGVCQLIGSADDVGVKGEPRIQPGGCVFEQHVGARRGTRRDTHRRDAAMRSGCCCYRCFAGEMNFPDRKPKFLNGRLYFGTVFLTDPGLGCFIRNADGEFTVVQRTKRSARNPILICALAELNGQRALDPIPSVSTQTVQLLRQRKSDAQNGKSFPHFFQCCGKPELYSVLVKLATSR